MPKTLRLVLPHGLMLLASVLLYWSASGIEAETGGGHRIGPDAWPRAIIAFMALLCVWEIGKRLAMRARIETRAAVPGPAGPAGAEGGEQAPFQPGKLAAGIALVFGYVVAVPWLGFFVATAAFLAAFPWMGGLRRPFLSLATGVAGSLALVVMFMRVAYISLPLGEGPFRALSIALLAAIGVS